MVDLLVAVGGDANAHVVVEDGRATRLRLRNPAGGTLVVPDDGGPPVAASTEDGIPIVRVTESVARAVREAAGIDVSAGTLVRTDATGRHGVFHERVKEDSRHSWRDARKCYLKMPGARP